MEKRDPQTKHSTRAFGSRICTAVVVVIGRLVVVIGRLVVGLLVGRVVGRGLLGGNVVGDCLLGAKVVGRGLLVGNVVGLGLLVVVVLLVVVLVVGSTHRVALCCCSDSPRSAHTTDRNCNCSITFLDSALLLFEATFCSQMSSAICVGWARPYQGIYRQGHGEL